MGSTQMEKNTDFKLSIIVPSLNEQASIALALNSIISAFENQGIKGEIVVVNDGSADGTTEIVEGFIKRFPFIRMIRHEKPMGLGASYWHGVREAQGEVVSWMGGSYESFGQDIVRYLPLLDHVDIVAPFLFNLECKSRHRQILSKIFRAIVNTTFGTNFNYTNGTLIYRKRILHDFEIRSTGYFFLAEFLIKAVRRGYLYAEVPFPMKKRVAGRSRITAGAILGVFKGYLYMVKEIYFSTSPAKSYDSNSITAMRWKEATPAETFGLSAGTQNTGVQIEDSKISPELSSIKGSY